MSSGECPSNWIVCPPCEGVADAAGDPAYSYDTVSTAPWYDRESEPTHRFLGVHALSIEGLSDSTREADIREGITDGGTVSRVRHAVRQVRARVLLSALGEDALEAGLGWLKAALDPDFCGTHGNSCGAVDSCFFTACPPTKASITAKTPVWGEVETNLATNPSFETSAGAPTILATNLATNPSFETAGVMTVLATNHIVNPSAETADGTSTLETNLLTNPSLEAIAALQELRRNLVANHPRLVNSTGDWSAQGDRVIAAGATGMVVDVPTAASLNHKLLRMEQAGPTPSAGTVWSTSVDVEVPAGYPTVVIDLGLEEESTHGWRGTPVTIYAGQKVRLSFGTTAVSGANMRIVIHADGEIPAGSRFIVSNLMWEKTLTSGPFFDGGTINSGDYTYLWTGTPEASASTQNVSPPVGITAGGYGTKAYSTTQWASNRSRSLVIIASGISGGPPPTDNFASVGGDQGGLRLGILPGKTYTFRATIRLTAPHSGADTRARRINVFNGAPSTGGYVETMSNQAPNVAGVYPLSVTFTTAADANDVFIRLYNGGATAGDTVWYDDLMLVEGDYTGGYFDGSSPPKTARNLALNPRAVLAGTPWVGPGGQPVPSNIHPNGHTTYETTGGGEIPTYVRVTGTASSSLAGMEVWPVKGVPNIAGQAYSGSVMVRSSVGATVSVSFWFLDAGLPASGVITPVTLTPNVWTKIPFSIVASTNPSNGMEMRVFTPSGVVIGNGQTLDVAQPILVASATAPVYFDGSMPGAAWEGTPDASVSYAYDPDFTYAWTGAPDASTSTMKGAKVKGAVGAGSAQTIPIQSGVHVSDRSRSVRVVQVAAVSAGNRVYASANVANLPNGTYTYSADVWVPAGSSPVRLKIDPPGTGATVTSAASTLFDQWERLSVTFMVDALGNVLPQMTIAESRDIGNEFWVDREIIQEGTSTDYFDGSSPDGDYAYDWVGTPDDGKSTASGMSVAGVTPPAVGQATATQTTDSPASGAFAIRYIIDTTGPADLPAAGATLTSGTVYTLLGKVRPRTRDQQFTPRIRGAGGPAFTAPKDVWTDFRITVAAGSGGAHETGLLLVGGSGHQPDDLVDMDSVAIVLGAYTGPYFDGSTPDGSFIYDWTGAVNGSTSTLSAVDVADATLPAPGTVVRWQDSESPVSGTRIARFQVTGTGDLYFPFAAYGHTTGETYTIVGKVRPKHRDTTLQVAIRGTKGPSFVAPMGVWTEFRAEIIAGSGAADTTGLFALAGAAQPGDVIDVDTVLMMLGTYFNQYFDGDTPDEPAVLDETLPVGTTIERFAWTGTPHASTSTREAGSIESAPDPVAWEDTVNDLLRTMHDVTCISGPLIEQKLHRDDMWGYIVEFTLAAGTPWLFGVTKSIVIPPTLPVVVQDVPYNLVPYPSAELASGTVVVAKNFAPNPSAESNVTGWTYALGGGLAGATTITQSNELAAAGGFSAKAAITVSNTGSGGALAVDLPTTLPVGPAGTRYSFNLWAAGSVQSGTAVLGTLDYHVIWLGAADAVLRTDTIGSGTASGGAKSLRSVLPPAGALKAVLRAHLAVTSYSAGAIIRLYADAAAVTVP